MAARPGVISEFPCASFSKRVLVQNLSYENEFDLKENKRLGGTHFHVNGFARKLVLTQRQKTSRKWPVANGKHIFHSDKYFGWKF